MTINTTFLAVGDGADGARGGPCRGGVWETDETVDDDANVDAHTHTQWVVCLPMAPALTATFSVQSQHSLWFC
eukprot:m.214722 g.214722  ORF g.214722 m.214722 type:complete len:73 (-) comp27313_c0_seq1:37-255(-)